MSELRVVCLGGRESHQRVDGLCLSFFLVKGGKRYMCVSVVLSALCCCCCLCLIIIYFNKESSLD